MRKTSSYQVATKFLQSQVGENRHPCEWYKGGCVRYQTVEMLLKDHRTVFVEHFRDIVKLFARIAQYNLDTISTISVSDSSLIMSFRCYGFSHSIAYAIFA